MTSSPLHAAVLSVAAWDSSSALCQHNVLAEGPPRSRALPRRSLPPVLESLIGGRRRAGKQIQGDGLAKPACLCFLSKANSPITAQGYLPTWAGSLTALPPSVPASPCSVSGRDHYRFPVRTSSSRFNPNLKIKAFLLPTDARTHAPWTDGRPPADCSLAWRVNVRFQQSNKFSRT